MINMITNQDDEELELIRKRKLEELRRYEKEQQIQRELQKQAEAQKQQILRKILTSEARERLGRLKIARPELVAEVERQLIVLAQTGRLTGVVDDHKLRQILSQVIPPKREIKIVRR
jgi:programmed cell death protein 5